MPGNVPMSRHAAQKVAERALDGVKLYNAYHNPEVVYPSHRYPGQEKRIADGVALCVDRASGLVITVFEHKIETDLRADQTDKDALAYGRRRADARQRR